MVSRRKKKEKKKERKNPRFKYLANFGGLYDRVTIKITKSQIN